MPELPSRVWRFIVSWGLSQTGAGFVFTFNFVYLAQARALGPAAAGAVRRPAPWSCPSGACWPTASAPIASRRRRCC